MDNANRTSDFLNKKVKLRIKDTGITLKIISWLQIVGGITGVFAGASFLLGVKGLAIDFNFFVITSSFQMTIFSQGEYYFKINFMAVFLIIVLYDIYNEKKQSHQIDKMEEIKM